MSGGGWFGDVRESLPGLQTQREKKGPEWKKKYAPDADILLDGGEPAAEARGVHSPVIVVVRGGDPVPQAVLVLFFFLKEMDGMGGCLGRGGGMYIRILSHTHTHRRLPLHMHHTGKDAFYLAGEEDEGGEQVLRHWVVVRWVRLCVTSHVHFMPRRGQWWGSRAVPCRHVTPNQWVG